MSCSYSAGSVGSASSSSDGQQLGARPKIGRQHVQQQMKPVSRSSAGQQRTTADCKQNKEWNSNWNAILSAQVNENRPIERNREQQQQQQHEVVRIKNINGQPPSAVAEKAATTRDALSNGWPAVSRGFSDPSLAVVQQPVPSSTATCRQKSPELFHSHHYHARRQRDRQQSNSRSSSAADLSVQSSINLSQPSSNASSLNNISKDSSSGGGGGGGISSIWARWFRRNNNRTSSSSPFAVRPFSSSYGGGGAGSRSHSVENSPVVSRRQHRPMTGSSGQLANNSDNSDSLSTNSFSFIRPTASHNIDPALTLRRKYGLMACSNESTDKMGTHNNNNNNNIEGDAIRAMRTRWESQMKHMDEVMRNEADEKCVRPSHPPVNNSTARKKRPAPQPPSGSANRRSASSRHSTGSIHAGSVASAGFAHVPGKRKAPSPPDPAPVQFNIVVPPPTTPNPAANGHLPDLMDSSGTPPSAAASPTGENKWNNDLNCNLLLDEMNKVKVFRYHQNKINGEQESKADCPHNDILKLEGGVLRPLESSAHKTNEPMVAASASTIDSNHRGMMTLPLKPWYKRGRNGSQLHHHPSSANASSRSKWKDAALLHPPIHPPVVEECSSSSSSWAMGLLANHHYPAPPADSTLLNTMRSNYSSTVSPGGSTRSEGSSSLCSDGSKGKQQRKSLLVNISQLDREATEIIQRERARESQRKRMEDEKFYRHQGEEEEATAHLASVPDVAEEPAVIRPSECEEKGTRQLINMFNSLTDSSSSINSQQKQTTAESSLRLRTAFVHPQQQQQQQQQSNANNKTMSEAGVVFRPTSVPEVAEQQSSSLLASTKAVDSNANTITRLRVNRETVAAPASPPMGNHKEPQQSIFNPKLEVVGSAEHKGGARPKNPVVSAASPLVNGHSKMPASNGWECQICTLLNSEARLWCEACTALKPRHFGNRSSSNVVTPPPVAKETASQTPDVPSAVATVTTAPNSPEALRQARLAFFLNGQQNKQPEMKEESDDHLGDKNNNKTTNNKRRSQYGGIKVSSSCQTQPMNLPSNKLVQRPVSMSDDPSPVVDKVNASRNSPAKHDGPIDNHNHVKPRVPAVVLKDVTPTNFALLSPSRTQLSQYLQQQQANKSQPSANGDHQSSKDIPKSKDDSPIVEDVSDEKRVEVMLWRLEESIAAGQFDKAAVLAKELAAIKRAPTSQSPSIKRRTPEPDVTPPTPPPAAINKPVAAPRSVLPAVAVAQKQSDPIIVPAASTVNDATAAAVPLPAKRLSQLSSPLPLPRKTIKEEDKQEETVKKEQVTIDVNQQTGTEKEMTTTKKMTNPEVTIRTKKRSNKISSGQQTTLTFQKKPSVGVVEESARRTQSCIVDDTFNVEVFIEDRSTHSGPFKYPVRPATTVLQLKEQMAKIHGIAMPSQRWIFGRRLADQEQLTLKEYDVCPSNSSLFLYVLPDLHTPPNPPKKSSPDEAPAKPQLDLVPAGNQRPEQNAKKYYNYQEDRYSTCDEDSDDELVAGPTALVNNNVAQSLPDHPLEPDTNKTDPHLTTTTINDEHPLQLEGATAVLGPVDAGWTCPGCTLTNSTTRSGCNGCTYKRPMDHSETDDKTKETRVDYKKLVDLLDQSDVVTNAESFDCPVCLMTVPAGVGVTLRECLHNFCRDCLAHVIEFSDEATITCPYRDDNYACDAVLQELEIKNLVGAKLYEKHLERSMRLAEKAMKNAFHCQTADCPGWAIIEEDNINVFRCPVCRKSNCLTCQAIHEGANCKEYQDQVNESADTDEDAKRTKEMIDALVASGEALSCPHCQVVLMKRWGCDWVRCSVCRTEICWVTKQNL
ncbi:hypothetical protein GHT06_014535 [Daphnia sinensis]|uniref:RanBP-type and C3HC4-type zinc finger-containing protein 1 n=1 Tax=Daphnia sinensis TaxID=1820382 RepID=A0AAD5L7Z0_9CRUS|nr:hypothetical protein GHT06_014535 [Daphnia sinensis]